VAAVDWARVSRLALPLAALVLAGVVGFLVGQRGAPSSQNRIASAERGWRGVTPAPASHSGVREREAGSAARTNPETLPGGPRDQTPEQASPVTRFRDFHITASSWELAHPPEYAVDGDPYTFWHAWKTERFNNGEWLTFTFPTERVITRIGLLPGRMGPGARAEGRVRSIMIKAAGATPQKLVFADRPEMQYRFLRAPVRTRKLVMRIGTVLPGRETRHILIPEVQIWGHRIASPLARRNGE
jgi:hypothetical protein